MICQQKNEKGVPGLLRIWGVLQQRKKRAKARARRQSERSESLASGFEEVTVIVPAAEAVTLRKRSKINRLEGRNRAAMMRGDTLEVQRRQATKDIALRQQKEDLQAEVEAALRAEANERAELCRTQREATERDHQSTAAIQPLLQKVKPDWMI